MAEPIDLAAIRKRYSRYSPVDSAVRRDVHDLLVELERLRQLHRDHGPQPPPAQCTHPHALDVTTQAEMSQGRRSWICNDCGTHGSSPAEATDGR